MTSACESIRFRPRQKQILELLLEGLSYKQIAFKLGLTYGTVKVYMAELTKRTGKTRLQLAMIVSQER
jgi:DNA-binding NarL/FixJ family response regulator